MTSHIINNINTNKQLLSDKLSDIITQNNQKNAPDSNLDFLTYQLAKENNISDRHLVSAHKFIECAKSLLDTIQSRQLGYHIIHIDNNNNVSLSEQDITVIEIVNDDMPFIVDSITQLLSEKEIDIIDFFHPVVSVERDNSGKFIAFCDSKNNKNGLLESLVHIHIPKISNPVVIDDLKNQIDSILQDTRKATSDWQVMLRKLDGIIGDLGAVPAPIDHETRQESMSFLRWLGMDHFTFLGYRSYRFEGNNVITVPDSGLGLFRNPDYVVLRHDGDMVDSFPELQKLAYLDMPVTVLKTNMQSSVHRRTHMDQIFIVFYDNGKPVGLHSFIGLFTSTAYSGRASKIPLLERKVQTIMNKSNFRPQGHDGKLLTHILDSYPRDELFQSDVETLHNIVTGIISLEQRPAIRLFPRHDLFNRFVSCLVYLPRERLNTDNRLKIGDLLAESYGGRVSNFSIWFSESTYVRIKYIIAATPSTLLTPDVTDLEAKIKKITTEWRDSFSENMLNHTLHNSVGTPEVARKMASDFSIAYQAHYEPKQAVHDISILSSIHANNRLVPHIMQGQTNNALIFRLFNYQTRIALSDCLPIFENLGFRVLSEYPFDLKHKNQPIQLHEFGMEYLGTGNPFTNIDNLSKAFVAIYSGQVENDTFNNLIIESDLSYRQVVVLRAFARYLKQIGLTYSHHKIAECLVAYPAISKLIWELFDIYHNPENTADNRDEHAHIIEEKINSALVDVAVLDQDTIIRRYVAVIKAVLRTNFYANKDYVSFKIDCHALNDLPLPVPYREIWVYSPRVEGIHLRFGKVARGGLRWSDRREDFRTEVLGLVKAQQVKNAVIVPVGAKGGFFAKQLPNPALGRDAWLAEGIEAYKIFISGLLDITDNIVNNQIVPPQNIIRRDGDDPYLVVAADKGTATFSDIANSLSLERNFWLGDAFASGGSNGYDHKKMAITARGAWEAVKRHFRETGKDIQTQEFTVCGVGDMSGDVFGNGMLLSQKIRLVAAFDHRDIFIDPNPDAAVSFAERKRLFDLPRSSWQDYQKDLISKGGGIFSRSLKEITLTPEIKSLTGLTKDTVRPTELMQAILKLDTELLWFGGIGTYIRGTHETDMQVGDKANDMLRITADDIRAKVIGEGANLGITQTARIALAMKGVMLNTDAVDNSAGVDCSDHEVNIKIALGIEQAAGRMNETDRNQLLEDMTDEVADLVLQTNYNQTLGLSITAAGAATRTDLHARFLNYLEAHAGLNRVVENLPDNRTLLAGRNNFKGLTKPELSVVMAYAKLKLYDTVLKSTIPDETLFDTIVKDYMPTPLHSMQEALNNHRLRREIITTVITNRAINEGGISFVFRLCERLNISTEHAMRSYVAARRMMNLDDLLQQVHQLDNKIPYQLQQKLYVILRRSLFDQTRRIALRTFEGFDIQHIVTTYHDSFTALVHNIQNNLGDHLKQKFNDFVAEHTHDNLSDTLRNHICALYFMKNGCDVIDITLESNKPLHETFNHYFKIIEKLDMDVLRRKATEIPLPDIYDQMALSQIIYDMDIVVKELVMKIFATHQEIDVWFDTRKQKLEKFQETFVDAVSTPHLGLSRLSIITGALRHLTHD